MTRGNKTPRSQRSHCKRRPRRLRTCRTTHEQREAGIYSVQELQAASGSSAFPSTLLLGQLTVRSWHLKLLAKNISTSNPLVASKGDHVVELLRVPHRHLLQRRSSCLTAARQRTALHRPFWPVQTPQATMDPQRSLGAVVQVQIGAQSWQDHRRAARCYRAQLRLPAPRWTLLSVGWKFSVPSHEKLSR